MANVNYHHAHYPGMNCNSRDGMPAPLGQEEARNMATSMYMHGIHHMAPNPPLLLPGYHNYYTEELPQALSYYDPLAYQEPAFAAAPNQSAFHTSSTPSPTPSPIYSWSDINPEDETMEFGFNQPASLPSAQPIYASPIQMPDASERTRCQWQNCTVELDDISHSGIRRHFRDFHNKARGSMVRCEWGGNCRSEEMLFDNIAKHIAECHLKSMRTACKSCGNTFARNDTLKRHLNAGCPALGRQG